MAEQKNSLYLKYRPSTLSGIYGNEEVIEAVDRYLSEQETCPHSFLLHGPTGCGKTTLARIIADSLGCSEIDFHELDSGHFRGIDTVREIRKQIGYFPTSGEVSVWVIDECHKMTNDAQNAMLKILEDTPKHVYFILATTDPQKLLAAIKNRCTTFKMNLLSDIQMKRLIRSVVKAEGEVLEGEVYNQIIQDSLGHPRNALQILDQVLRVGPEKRLAMAEKSAQEQSQSIELCRLLLSNQGWAPVRAVLVNLKDQDAEGIRRQVLGYAQAILLKSDNERAGLVLEEFLDPFYNSGYPGLVYACYSVVKN